MLGKIKIFVFVALAATPLLAAETALHRAAKGDAPAVILKLLPGTDLGARDKDGKTALFIAAEADRVDLVRILSDAGASIHVTDAQQNTLMHVAALHGNNELALFLIELKANLALKNRRGSCRLISPKPRAIATS